MGRLVEVVAPARLGPGFRWLLAAGWLSNLGDGMAIAAGPLLVASMTSDPLPVALGALAGWLPPLLFSLYAGVLSDRVDRRLIVLALDGGRAVVLGLLATAVLTGPATVPVVLGALFTAAALDVFSGNANSTMLPLLVGREELAVGNARLMTGAVTLQQLAGPSVGALLFTLGHAVPVVAQAALVGLAAVTISRVALPARTVADRVARRVRHDVAEGLRWVGHHAAVRTLVLTIFIFNITYGAAFSVLVVYAARRLGLGEIGYGLLSTVMALGGLVATVGYGWLTRRVTLGNLMQVGLVVETLTHLCLAVTTTPWVATVVFFVFGVHAFVWGTTSVAVRQRAVPLALQGRVAAVNSLGSYGGLVIGSGVGGVLARRLGITAPFWFAFAGSALFVVALWGQMRHVVHVDASPAA